MIISASRRTDIPALYSRWFMGRIRAGFCDVPNPFNSLQVSRISLQPSDVDAIVFWTRHARPLLPHLPELARHGFRYYFQYTITGYGPPVERRNPPLTVATATFRDLAARLPQGAVVWRYDPILLGQGQPFTAAAHRERFARIAEALQGATDTVVVSLLTVYRKTERRMGAIYGWETDLNRTPAEDPSTRELLHTLVGIATDHGMRVQTCAQIDDYSDVGAKAGKCIDDQRLTQLFGGRWIARKDPGQRRACGCVPSRDIGMPDTCTLGCNYCYATRSDDYARRRFAEHSPQSSALLGEHDDGQHQPASK